MGNLSPAVQPLIITDGNCLAVTGWEWSKARDIALHRLHLREIKFTDRTRGFLVSDFLAAVERLLPEDLEAIERGETSTTPTTVDGVLALVGRKRRTV